MDLSTWIDRHVEEGRPARLTAGFRWEWSKQRPGEPFQEDIVIDWVDDGGTTRTWKRPWNASAEVLDGGAVSAPRREYWVTDDNGHLQVGRIYTSQGLEYHLGGVIIGLDLVRRGDRWEAHPEHSHDNEMRKASVSPEDYLRLARSICCVLLSRASHGCQLYSTDPETQRFLESLFAPTGPDLQRHRSLAADHVSDQTKR